MFFIRFLMLHHFLTQSISFHWSLSICPENIKNSRFSDVFRNYTKKTSDMEWLKGKAVTQTCSIKKETLAQVFSCEFCKISKSIFFYRTPLVAASVKGKFH